MQGMMGRQLGITGKGEEILNIFSQESQIQMMFDRRVRGFGQSIDQQSANRWPTVVFFVGKSMSTLTW